MGYLNNIFLFYCESHKNEYNDKMKRSHSLNELRHDSSPLPVVHLPRRSVDLIHAWHTKKLIKLQIYHPAWQVMGRMTCPEADKWSDQKGTN